MPTRFFSFRVVAVAAPIWLIALACAAQPVPSSSAPPLTAGQARVWFYRVFFPEDTGGMPAVAMNGNTVGYARAGSSFYRDVPAGPYHVTVESVGVDFDQAKDIVLAPGAQAYLAIQSDPSWIEDRRGFRRPTYYVGIEPPRIAAIHLSQSTLGTGY